MSRPLLSLRVREAQAISSIAHHGSAGWIDGEVLAVQQHGFRDVEEFWCTALSEPITVRRFVTLLSVFQHDPGERPDSFNLRVVNAIEDAIKLAFEEREPWFIEKTFSPSANKSFYDHVKLYPRRAAEWMMIRPKTAERVPFSLHNYLRGAQHKTIEGEIVSPRLEAPSSRPPRKRGRQPDVRDRVKAAMAKYDRDTLANMKEEEMAATFGASRCTCRVARKELLSLIVEN